MSQSLQALASVAIKASKSTPKSIYIIAGEVSGDTMAAKIIDELRMLHGDIQFYGVGGEKMTAHGIVSLFDIKHISLMGFFEIIPHIFLLQRLTRWTAEDIQKKKPNIVVTIDSPGFCYRVAQLVKRSSPEIKLLHIVAPSVWVYKPERAKKFAAVYDHLLTLLSFEPPYFEQEGLASTFIGHPVFEQDFGGGPAFRMKHAIDNETKLILVTPGSRKSEITRHLPVFRDALERLVADDPKYLVCFALAGHENVAELYLKNTGFKYMIVSSEDRLASYAAADIALAKSGTNTIEIAASKTPMIVAYKLNILTYTVIKILAKVKYASLINIIGEHEIIPEFLQFNCRVDNLYLALKNILDRPEIGEHQIDKAHIVLRQMGYGSKTKPSAKAAETILQVINQQIID